MPNWCMNSAVFHHSDPAMILKLSEALKKGEVCRTFVPIEEEWAKLTANPDFVDEIGWQRIKFQTDHWGTKWDFGDDADTDLVNENTLTVPNFLTAWSPPIGLYNKMIEMGFEITAYYFEPGCCFCGTYMNGSEEIVDIKEQSDIPEEVRDTFDTDQYYQNDEEEVEDN